MKQRDRIMDYLQGDRKGKAANRLERDALSDPFLYEALEGLTKVEGEHLRAINRLQRRIGYKVQPSVFWRKITVVIIIGLCLGIFFFLFPFHQAPKPVKGTESDSVRIDETNSVTVDWGISEVEEDTMSVLRDSISTLQEQKQLPSFVDSLKETVNQSHPIGGFEAFYRYIQDSLIYPEDALKDSLEGDIELTFVVNKYGRPSHIRVVRWITYSCNREAIRLLNEGPLWSYTGSEKTVSVVIPFRLKR